MGKIVTSTRNRFGKETTTTVRTNGFEDFLINSVARLGRGLEWKLVHRIEKRKLAKK